MSNFHPKFPYGKGMWIWYIKHCLEGDLEKIAKKARDNDISYLIIKCGDGEYTWSQFTPNLVQFFKDRGIKVYSWTYNYGKNPLREAAIASWALDMGVEGHVFNAESEFKYLPDNKNAALTMFLKVREKHPHAFLAHAPFAFPEFHSQFPYMEFGKYCDAVMPQLYWGTMKRTPQNVIMTMYEQWSRLEKKWRDSGNTDAIKPLIPIGQGYDNYEITPNYILNPGDLKVFIDGVAGYKSVNFWSFQHILRDDCWNAIRDTKLTPTTTVSATEKPAEISSPVNPNPQNEGSSTPAEQTPAQTEPSQPSQPSSNTVEIPSSDGNNNVSLPSDNLTNPEPVEKPVETVTPSPVKPQEPELPAKVEIPKDGKTTVEVKHNPDCPDGIEVKVRHHKRHVDYFLELIEMIRKVVRFK